MAAVIAPFDVWQYNALRPFYEARSAAADDRDVMIEKCKTLFRKYNVEHLFGLCILHKHFDLEAGERLIDFNGTSVPIEFEGATASIWKVDEGKMIPLEFIFDGSNELLPENAELGVFLQDFSDLVGKDSLWGLRRHPGQNFDGSVEFTVDRTNITLPPDLAKRFFGNEEGFSQAAWFFTDDFITRGCKCLCADDKEHGHLRHTLTASV